MNDNKITYYVIESDCGFLSWDSRSWSIWTCADILNATPFTSLEDVDKKMAEMDIAYSHWRKESHNTKIHRCQLTTTEVSRT